MLRPEKNNASRPPCPACGDSWLERQKVRLVAVSGLPVRATELRRFLHCAKQSYQLRHLSSWELVDPAVADAVATNTYGCTLRVARFGSKISKKRTL